MSYYTNSMSVISDEPELIGDPNYYKQLKIKEGTTVSDALDIYLKKIPKRISYAKIHLRINDIGRYCVYEHDKRKIIRDRREYTRETYGGCIVKEAYSNIDWGEHYYTFCIDAPKAPEPVIKTKTKTIPEKPQPKKEKTAKQTVMDTTGMTKAQMKEILMSRGVRVYYHDTLDILRAKIRESEKSEKKGRKNEKRK